MRAMAERMAARSTRHGTPLKSCSTTRAGLEGDLNSIASHLASLSTSFSVISNPSHWRSAASSMTFMEKGSRATEAMPDFSRWSRRYRAACPWPVSNAARAPKELLSFVMSFTSSICVALP